MTTLQEYFKKKEKIIGSIASVISIIMFVSLIEIFISNMQGKSHILIQPSVTAVNGIVWSMYAYGKKDWFLLIPNLLAVVLGLITAASALI